jgi:2-methylisocitrate lyase-like PEP mutase family enzyme
MKTQAEKAAEFQGLHEAPGTFVIPNPWDAGSAVILAAIGFPALATTSAGFAFSIGRADGAVGRDAMLEHARDIVAATDLPVSADLENGYGDAPEDAAETIRLAAEAGLCGASIEDATGRADDPIYPFDHAVERVAAAVAAARALSHAFVLTARAENLLHGRDDLADTTRRLVAFAEAGADVLYAPGLRTAEEVAAVVRAVAPKPVNVLVGGPGPGFTVASLQALGVKRISVGSALARTALGAFVRAAEEIKMEGTFAGMADAAPFARVNGLFRLHAPASGRGPTHGSHSG